MKGKTKSNSIVHPIFDGISDSDIIDATYEKTAGTYKQEFRLCQVLQKGFNPKKKRKTTSKQALKKGRDNEETAMSRLHLSSLILRAMFHYFDCSFSPYRKKRTWTSID